MNGMHSHKLLPVFIRLSGFAAAGFRTPDLCGLDMLSTLIQAFNVRFWPVHADERPIGTLVIGNPESKEVLGYLSTSHRLRNALVIAGTILVARVYGRPYAWPWMAAADWSSLGFCSRLIAIALGRKRDLI